MTCIVFADHEKAKAGKVIRDLIRQTESITGNTEIRKKRFRILNRAAIHTRRVVTDEMIILQDLDDK